MFIVDGIGGVTDGAGVVTGVDPASVFVDIDEELEDDEDVVNFGKAPSFIAFTTSPFVILPCLPLPGYKTEPSNP